MTIASLERLARDWRSQIARAERLAKDAQTTPVEHRLLRMQVRQLSACMQDLEDLIAGREHPASRRGEQLAAGRDGHG